MTNWKVGDLCTDKYYHPDMQGKVISLKGNEMWVDFNGKRFKYSRDTTSLVRV